MKEKKSRSEMIFDICNYIFIALFSISILYPFWDQIVQSISLDTGIQGFNKFKIWPEVFTFKAYGSVFRNPLLLRAYANTIFRTVVGTMGTTLFSSALAYSLSKKYLWHRNIWTILVIITMFIGGGTIPTYMLIKSLNLLNTIWVYVIPGLVSGSQVFLIRNYMMTIPIEIEESARIDGANDIYIFATMILPTSKPILATVALWNAVGHWNAWYDALIYNDKKELLVAAYFLQKILRQEMVYAGLDAAEQGRLIQSKVSSESLKSAILITTVLPIVFIYPFLQKYFVKGIIIGSLKG